MNDDCGGGTSVNTRYARRSCRTGRTARARRTRGARGSRCASCPFSSFGTSRTLGTGCAGSTGCAGFAGCASSSRVAGCASISRAARGACCARSASLTLWTLGALGALVTFACDECDQSDNQSRQKENPSLTPQQTCHLASSSVDSCGCVFQPDSCSGRSVLHTSAHTTGLGSVARRRQSYSPPFCGVKVVGTHRRPRCRGVSTRDSPPKPRVRHQLAPVLPRSPASATRARNVWELAHTFRSNSPVTLTGVAGSAVPLRRP